MADLPYQYYVSYSHGQGYGGIHVRTDSPVDRYEHVDQFRHTIAGTPNDKHVSIRVEDIVILNFILLSGPEEGQR